MTPRSWLRGLRSATKLMTSLRSRDGVRRSRQVELGDGLRRLEALEDRSLLSSGGAFPQSGPASLRRTLTKAQSYFSSLADQTITYGAGRTTVSGKITSGPLIPTGSVLVTLNGVKHAARIASVGNFTTTFNTARLPAGSYTITYRYSGSANFQAVRATTTLTVRYGLGSDQPGKRQHRHRSEEHQCQRQEHRDGKNPDRGA